MDAAEEADVIQARRAAAKLVREEAVAGDQQVGGVVLAKGVDERVDAREPHESTDEEKVRTTLARPIYASGRRRRGRPLGEKVGKLPHRIRKPPSPMFADRRLAGREEEIDVRELALEDVRVTPELGRALVREGAAKTLRLLAELPVSLP